MWKRLLPDIVWDAIIRPIFLPLLAGALIAMWQILQNGMSPTVVVVFTLMVAGGLVIIQTLRAFAKDRGFAGRSNEYIESQLRAWLDKEGLKISSAPDGQMLFQFKAEDNSQRSLTVARPKKDPNFVFVGGRWNIPEAERIIINGIQGNLLANMIEDMRLELLRLGVNYSDLNIPLKQIGAEVRVACDDTCTRAYFLSQFEKARNAYVIMLEILRRYIRKAGYDPDKALSQQRVPGKAKS